MQVSFLVQIIQCIINQNNQINMEQTNTTITNVALELNSVNGALVTLLQLPGIPYLRALSLPLTLIDF